MIGIQILYFVRIFWITIFREYDTPEYDGHRITDSDSNGDKSHSDTIPELPPSRPSKKKRKSMHDSILNPSGFNWETGRLEMPVHPEPISAHLYPRYPRLRWSKSYFEEPSNPNATSLQQLCVNARSIMEWTLKKHDPENLLPLPTEELMDFLFQFASFRAMYKCPKSLRTLHPSALLAFYVTMHIKIIETIKPLVKDHISVVLNSEESSVLNNQTNSPSMFPKHGGP